MRIFATKHICYFFYCRCLVGILLLCGMTVVRADVEDAPDHRLRSAHEIFHEVMNTPDKGIPLALYDKAECIIIIPGVKKGAFIVGGKYGRGFASCRRGTDRKFGAPAAIRIEGGSYGLQIGGSSTDVFMLVMNENGMKHLLSDKFTLGGEAAATAGPVGRNASADTDVVLHAEILSWSRSRGLFAGLSLEGATMRPDGSENRKLYGRDISNEEILQGDVAVPRAGRELIVTLNRYSANMHNAHADLSKSLQNSGRVRLDEVHFASGKADLTPDSEAGLTSAAKVLSEHPDWKIRVDGFTDSVGDKDANLRLSQDRAEAVAAWLAGHGINRDRLSAKGFGEAHPAGSNATESGRQRNRRVELVRQ